ncbi:hypothetical protein COO60DRAFT_1527702, partial [Scenedesmus sp. NREL 46B-D3]
MNSCACGQFRPGLLQCLGTVNLIGCAASQDVLLLPSVVFTLAPCACMHTHVQQSKCVGGCSTSAYMCILGCAAAVLHCTSKHWAAMYSKCVLVCVAVCCHATPGCHAAPRRMGAWNGSLHERYLGAHANVVCSQVSCCGAVVGKLRASLSRPVLLCMHRGSSPALGGGALFLSSCICLLLSRLPMWHKP